MSKKVLAVLKTIGKAVVLYLAFFVTAMIMSFAFLGILNVVFSQPVALISGFVCTILFWVIPLLVVFALAKKIKAQDWPMFLLGAVCALLGVLYPLIDNKPVVDATTTTTAIFMMALGCWFMIYGWRHRPKQEQQEVEAIEQPEVVAQAEVTVEVTQELAQENKKPFPLKVIVIAFVIVLAAVGGYSIGSYTGNNDYAEGYNIGYGEGYFNGYSTGEENGLYEGYKDGYKDATVKPDDTYSQSYHKAKAAIEAAEEYLKNHVDAGQMTTKETSDEHQVPAFLEFMLNK